MKKKQKEIIVHNKETNKNFTMLSISDVHLYLTRIPTIAIVNILTKSFLSVLETGAVQFLSINGDLFDGIIFVNGPEFLLIHNFLVQLLQICDKYDITVRILQGTFSHDRNQIKWVVQLHESLGLKNDLRFFNSIDVEYIPRFDITMGYIPDSLPYNNTEEVLDVLKEKMKVLEDPTTLDYVSFHGTFEHTVASYIEKKPKLLFQVKQFKFVKKAVLAGHIHTPSIKGNVYYGGSPNRLAHNEEEAKGFYLFHDYGDHFTAEFITNEHSPIFSTLNFSKESDVSKILSEYIKKINVFKVKSEVIFVRIIHPDIVIRQAIKTYSEKHYPYVIFTHISPKEVNNYDYSETEVVDISLTVDKYSKEALSSDIHDFILSKHQYDLPVKNIDKYLKELTT